MPAPPLPEDVTTGEDWWNVFGHDEPYPEQEDGIDAVGCVRRSA